MSSPGAVRKFNATINLNQNRANAIHTHIYVCNYERLEKIKVI